MRHQNADARQDADAEKEADQSAKKIRSAAQHEAHASPHRGGVDRDKADVEAAEASPVLTSRKLAPGHPRTEKEK
jgi:hypothetical protein